MVAPNMLAALMQMNNVQAPQVDLSYVSQGLGNMFHQMQENQDRQRLLADHERAQKEARLKASDEMVSRMAQAGLGDSAAAAYKQSQGLRQDLYGLSGPDILGGRNPDGTTNKNDPTTLGMLQRLSGQTPPKPEALDPFKTYVDPVSRQVIQKAQPKPVNPQFFANGTGMWNPQTNSVQSTGFVPPMTPDQQVDNARQDKALAFRQQVQSEAQSLRNSAAKIKDERGMAALRLRVKQWARKTATNDMTGIVDSEKAALNEEQLMQELNLISQTQKDKDTAAKAGDTTANKAANDKANKALTNIYGGGQNYLAFSQAFPPEHEALRNYFVARAKGDKKAQMPLTGEQIRTMLEQAKSGDAPKPQATASPGVKVAEDVLKGIKF